MNTSMLFNNNFNTISENMYGNAIFEKFDNAKKISDEILTNMNDKLDKMKIDKLDNELNIENANNIDRKSTELIIDYFKNFDNRTTTINKNIASAIIKSILYDGLMSFVSTRLFQYFIGLSGLSLTILIIGGTIYGIIQKENDKKNYSDNVDNLIKKGNDNINIYTDNI